MSMAFSLTAVVKRWLGRTIWLGQWLKSAELREGVSRLCFSENTPRLPLLLLAFCKSCSLGGYRSALPVPEAVEYQQKKIPVRLLPLAGSWASPPCSSCPSVTQDLSFLFPWTALRRLWRQSCSVSRAGGRQSEAGRVKCSVCILLILTYRFQWDEVSAKEKWDWQADRSSGIRGRPAPHDKSEII